MYTNNEPPLPSSPTVFVGQNDRGDWVACEQHGLFGGLFINYAEALRYALFENGHHEETIIRVSGRSLELNI
ncbi:MAG: hypothetical protein K2W78_01285 [Xanthobacteraceae bacterium]|nr:hypothetical protein [Xanthobacteraceae bacterium]